MSESRERDLCKLKTAGRVGFKSSSLLVPNRILPIEGLVLKGDGPLLPLLGMQNTLVGLVVDEGERPVLVEGLFRSFLGVFLSDLLEENKLPRRTLNDLDTFVEDPAEWLEAASVRSGSKSAGERGGEAG